MSSFWNYFYKKKSSVSSASNFAKFCKKNYIIKNSKLLEIGCGNGRDAFYFYKNNIFVTAIDKSKEVIQLNKLKNKKIKFLNFDINNKKFFKVGKFDFIYARFFLHTIDKRSQIRLFDNLSKIGIKNKTKILLEFRTIKDPLYKLGKKIGKHERFTDHYRRFIDVKEIEEYFRNNTKFKIIKLIEKKGLARHKKENPVVCRLILKKK